MSIRIKNLSFGYKSSPVLKDLSVDIPSEQVTMLLGGNGAGKSTLFKCILSVINKYQGEIWIDDIKTTAMTTKELSRHIAYIPQSGHTAFNYTVADMIVMGVAASLDMFSSPDEEDYKRADDIMESLSILHLRDKGYHHLSGGERQMVLIARALIQNSHILILDEPIANLDFGNQIRVLETVKNLTQKGYTIILSTHNPDHCFMYADNVIAICDGAIISNGTPEEVITSELISKIYKLDTIIHTAVTPYGKYKNCLAIKRKDK